MCVQVTKIEGNLDQAVADIEEQYKIIWQVCELDAKKPFNRFSDCTSTAVIRYNGCVRDNKAVYLFLEDVSNQLDYGTQSVLENYYLFPGKKKAEIMISVILKFQQLHAKGIVHGNIRGSNIVMHTLDFLDARIVGFGKSGPVGKQILKGDPYFFPSGEYGPQTLSFDKDVYALAHVFGKMELSMRKHLRKNFDKKCFDKNIEVTAECLNSLRSAAIDAFNKKNQTDVLRKIMKTALSKKPEKRYQSMTDFAKAIEDVKNTFPTEAVKRNLKDELDDRNVFKKMIDYVNDIDFMF